MTTNHVYALDLDWDLISHLALPVSLNSLRSEQFRVELIEDPLARKVFQWQMAHYREHGQGASAAVLEDQFGEITIADPQTAVGDLIERLRTRHMRNRGREILTNISLAVNEDPLSVGKLLLRSGRELADLTAERGEVFGSGDYWRLMELYDRKAQKGRGPSLGYRYLDDHFYGLLGVTFLIGPPKSGKSWFAVNCVKENILAKRHVYAYSLELPADEYAMRLQHIMADIPYSRYLRNAYMPSDRHVLKEASEQLDSEGLYTIEKPQPGERGVQRMVERALNAGADMVIFDQLQYMETRKGVSLGTANNTGDYWEVCNDLRDYSDEIPIFVVHQFNRSVLNAKEMPEAQQAKGSAAVEEVATLALGMWANREMRRNQLIHVGTLASRNYEHETWELEVNLQHGCALDMIGVVEDVPDDE